MRIGDAVMVFSELREVAGLRLRPAGCDSGGVFLSSLGSELGAGRDKESVPRGRGPLDDVSRTSNEEQCGARRGNGRHGRRKLHIGKLDRAIAEA